MHKKKEQTILRVVEMLAVVILVFLLLPSKSKNLGEQYNSLSAQGESNKRNFYVAFINADGDDIWRPDKTDDSKPDSNNTSNKPISKDIQKILDMSEEEFWLYITENKCKSKSEVARMPNPVQFTSSLCSTFTAKIWVWKDSTHKEKVTKNKTITCNKYVLPIFQAALDEIYSDPSKPIVQDDVYVYSYRGSTGGSGISAHAVGIAIDINAYYNPQYLRGGSNPSCGGADLVNGAAGRVISKSQVDNANADAWEKEMLLYKEGIIVKTFCEKYTMKWGACFRYNNSAGGDRMHFSLAGDGVNWRNESKTFVKDGWAEFYKRGEW